MQVSELRILPIGCDKKGGMMDDTPDKVRRNLLVYCGALLIGWYLDIDFKTILNMPGFNVPKLDPLKTTSLSLVILCYLMARFLHSKEYKEGGGYKVHFQGLPYDLVLDYVRKALRDYSQNGRAAKRASIFDWTSIDASIEGLRRQGGRMSESQINVDFGQPNQPAQDRVGTISITGWSMIDQVRININSPVFPDAARYKIPKRVAAVMKLKIFWRMVMRDENFISAKFPTLLGLITYFYLMIKLIIISAGL